MITRTGVDLYRWYSMGIMDPADLFWLVEFYTQQHGWNQNLVLAELQAARRYYAQRSAH